MRGTAGCGLSQEAGLPHADELVAARSRHQLPPGRFPAISCCRSLEPPIEAPFCQLPPTPAYFSVAYMIALMECMRFSASSNTTDRGPSNTSSVTSSSTTPNFSATRAPTSVFVSW